MGWRPRGSGVSLLRGNPQASLYFAIQRIYSGYQQLVSVSRKRWLWSTSPLRFQLRDNGAAGFLTYAGGPDFRPMRVRRTVGPCALAKVAKQSERRTVGRGQNGNRFLGRVCRCRRSGGFIEGARRIWLVPSRADHIAANRVASCARDAPKGARSGDSSAEPITPLNHSSQMAFTRESRTA